jgi:hypothetical protein
VAFPATSLLDRQGRVRSRFLEEFYRETEYKRQSLLLLNPGNGPAPVAGTKISSEHLDLITCPTKSGIAPAASHLYLNQARPWHSRLRTWSVRIPRGFASHHPAADRARPSYQVSGV